MQRSHIFTDHLGYKVRLEKRPERIISLVPSITETLYDLGLGKQIVGRTKFCIHPANEVAQTPKIGGTKILDFDKINELKPDLIIANKEENRKEDVEYLQEHHTVWISDIKNLDQGIKLIKELGILLQALPGASKLTKLIANEERTLTSKIYSPATVAYLIWKDPLMTVGADTYIHSTIRKCGFINVFEKQDRYPIIQHEDLIKKQPDYIFLSSEPFPFKEKHIQEFKDLGIQSKIVLVDGEMFSWYGSRIVQALSYFQTVKHNYLEETHLNVN